MTPEPKTEKTEQNVQNISFDPQFNILTAEMIGYDGTNLQRVSCQSDGTLNIA